MDIFWGSSQNWTSLGVIFMYFSVFKLYIQNVDIFGGCKNFKYFLGVLDITDVFGCLTVDAGSKPTYEYKMRVPPGIRAC